MSPRIAILTGIFPPDIGGPATSVPELATSFVGFGHRVVVITLSSQPNTGEEDPVPVIRIPREFSRMRRMASVRHAVASVRPDVVLANGLHLESAILSDVPVAQKLVGDWAWERARNSRATTLGPEEFQTAKIGMKLRALRSLRSRVTQKARLVVVPSQYLRRLVLSWGVSERLIRVIPNAAPPLQSTAPQRPRSGRALFVGRLVSWKHVNHVLRVLPRFPAMGLDIVGTGPEMQSLRRLTADLSVHERVAFLGVLPRPQVLELMGKASFLVLPSSYEGMPHVVLEAFARGLPVVASNAGGTPELVADRRSGLLYEFGNLDALEGAMKSALIPDVAASVVEGGLEVTRRLTPAALADATDAALREIVPQ